MDKTIISDIHKQWVAVKSRAALEYELKGCPNLAQAYRKCEMFKGTENVQQLAELLTKPRAVEFCLKYDFPNLGTMRLFKGENLEDSGIYIDSHEVHLINPQHSNIVLVGNVSADIEISDNTRLFNVTLMHGARAKVKVSDWAVVAICEGEGCKCIREVTGNAAIL